jgi:hypothetical protein
MAGHDFAQCFIQTFKTSQLIKPLKIKDLSGEKGFLPLRHTSYSLLTLLTYI